MENEETKNQTSALQSNKEDNLETLTAELETIKANIQRGKSETTTLKILFYTGLAVLLFGFVYTSQTLQRAQSKNIDSTLSFMQSQVNHTLLLLENKLHREIRELEARVDGESRPGLHKSIQNMNQALDQLEPQTTALGILIEKVQRNSNELSQMVQQTQEAATP
jgi:flagellin-like hook-associated protein FlgL